MGDVLNYKYKYSKQCVVCRYLRRHPDVKTTIINARMFNPQSNISIADIHSSFFIHSTINTVRNHMKKHILPMEYQPVSKIMKNDKLPEVQKATVLAVGESKKEQFERTLDEYITQFDEGLRNREFKLTVKDGLAALKIKADLVNKNKDRKSDILKAMMGARGESGRPPERTET